MRLEAPKLRKKFSISLIAANFTDSKIMSPQPQLFFFFKKLRESSAYLFKDFMRYDDPD